MKRIRSFGRTALRIALPALVVGLVACSVDVDADEPGSVESNVVAVESQEDPPAGLSEQVEGAWLLDGLSVHPERGVYLMHHPPGGDAFEHFASLDELRDTLGYVHDRLRSHACELQQAPGDVDCESGAGLTGCFYEPPSEWRTLEQLADFLLEFGMVDHATAAQAREQGRAVTATVNLPDAQLRLHFGSMDGEMHLFVIDAAAFECD